MKYIILALVFFLISCNSEPELSFGYVLKKEFIKKHDDTEILFIGESVIPMTVTVPDKYFVWFGKDSIIERLEVTENLFNSIEIGKFYNLPRK